MSNDNMELEVPKTPTPERVQNWHIGAPIAVMLAISVIIFLVIILLAKIGINISPLLILSSIPIVLLAYYKKEEILELQYLLVPMYFVLVVIDEVTGKKRVLFDKLSKIAPTEKPELAPGNNNAYHYLDLKRIIAFDHGNDHPLIFETKKGGSAQVNYLLSLSVKIDPNSYEISNSNVLRFNAMHSHDLIEELDKVITGWMSSFYSSHEFEEGEAGGEGLVYESWVNKKMFGEDGKGGIYGKERVQLEKNHGVKIGIVIYNSNPVQEILDARNKLNKVRLFNLSVKEIATSLRKQKMPVGNSDVLAKLIHGYSTESNHNYNVKIDGLQQARNISITAFPTSSETSKPKPPTKK